MLRARLVCVILVWFQTWKQAFSVFDPVTPHLEDVTPVHDVVSQTSRYVGRKNKSSQPHKELRSRIQGAQILISHHHKWIQIRQPKSGSTSLRKALEKMCDSLGFKQIGLPDGDRFFSGCYTPIRADEFNLWPDYFVWSTIRNPWQRAYSIYNQMVRSGYFTAESNCPSSMSWIEHCKDPITFALDCDSKSPSASPSKKKHGPSQYLFHARQQHSLLVNNRSWTIDFLADINSPSSLADLALLEPSLATPLSNAQTHKKNVYSDPKNMSNVIAAYSNNDCLFGIAKTYLLDIEWLG